MGIELPARERSHLVAGRRQQRKKISGLGMTTREIKAWKAEKRWLSSGEQIQNQNIDLLTRTAGHADEDNSHNADEVSSPRPLALRRPLSSAGRASVRKLPLRFIGDWIANLGINN